MHAAKIIGRTKCGISFSQVVNETLRQGLKNGNGKHDQNYTVVKPQSGMLA